MANLFLERGYNVVANSRHISQKNALQRSDNLALVDGDIALPATAEKLVDTAMQRFGSVDVLVNNAGIFFAKPFTDYTTEDFRALSSTNLDGFIHITQRVIKQMLAQESGGSVVSVTASIADHPLAAMNASAQAMASTMPPSPADFDLHRPKIDENTYSPDREEDADGVNATLPWLGTR